MTRWIADALAELRTRPGRVAVVVDPDGVAGDIVDITGYGDVRLVPDVWQLRCAYELEGRRRAPERPRLMLVLRDASIRDRRQLPWDLSRLPVAVLVAPVPLLAQPLVHALSGALADEAVAAAQHGQDPLSALLRRGWDVTLPTADAGHELAGAIRLSTSAAPAAIRTAASAATYSPLACAALADPPDVTVLTDAWRDWLDRGSASPYDSAWRGCGPAVLALVHQGLIAPAPLSAADLPAWAVAGGTVPSRLDRVRALLGAPTALSAATAVEWFGIAEWWGQLRAAAAAAAPLPDDVRHAVETVWRTIDAAFRPWLRREFGGLLTRTATPPVTVDKIASFLARRLRSGTPRALLLVMDGLALSQWHQLRELMQLTVRESTACFAMLPTVTTVSRQAIFAGAPPTRFADTIDRTSREERRWRDFWAAEGLDPHVVGWAHLHGSDAQYQLAFDARHRVVGVVVNAIDDIMHGSDVNGDAQMYAAVEVWSRHGFLRQLVEDAATAGFEVWVTADHGNVEGRGVGMGPQEGIRVSGRGQRVRLYREEIFRQRSRLTGEAWTPPSYPQSAGAPLFPSGRECYTNLPTLVSHGGLSLDEVIVPLARVEP